MPLRGDWRRRVGHDVGDWRHGARRIEGPVLFDAGFVFNMLGFVLALAACVLFLCGHALYYQATSRASSMPIVCWPLVFKIA